MHRLSSTAISLLPASKDDIPLLIRIHMAAFADDNSARLMFKNNDEAEQKLLEMLNEKFSCRDCAVIKAVSKDTGNILGWQSCRFRNKNDDLEGEGAVAGVEEAQNEPRDEMNGPRCLRSVLNENFVKFQNDWMANKRYIHFTTLVVDPAAQGHGTGTALVRWITDKADEHGIYCWLQSSQAAHGIYLKAGFKDVGKLEIDLREFAPGGKEGKWGWGPYEFGYMLRLPEE